MDQNQKGIVVGLLTEMACCTIDIHDEVTTDVLVCKNTIRFLAKNDPTLLDDFMNATNAVKQNKKDGYITKEYPEKSADLRKAIRMLEALAKDSSEAPKTVETLNKAAKLLSDFYDVEKRDAIYFITEQTCCLIQAIGKESEDVKICEQAMQFLTHNNLEQLKAFKEHTDAAVHNPNADYDTEQYDGKRTDVRHAVDDLMELSIASETPTEQGERLRQVAQMIEAFYGMDGILPETI